MGFGVARELGLTLVVRLWVVVALLEVKAEGLIVRRGERELFILRVRLAD